MNPTDLRAELTTRAGDSEQHEYGDLLPGVRRKIRTTKRRRVAVAVAGTAAVAALAAGVLPNLTGTSNPNPATTKPVPQDVARNGIVFPGEVDGHVLQAAAIGNPGQTTVWFDWTPDSTAVSGRTVCSASSTARSMRVSVDGIAVTEAACTPGETAPIESFIIQPSDAIWTSLRPGTKTRIELTLVDSGGRTVPDASAVLGAGFYTGRQAPSDPMPSVQPPTGPNDYVKDGIRYRTPVGGDTLVAAAIADRGRTELTFEFTPATDLLSLRPFCMAGDRYQLAVTINGRSTMGGSCGMQTTDPGSGGGMSGMPGQGLPEIRPGEVNTATLRLTDAQHRPVSLPTARIGLGIYQLGTQRLVGDDGNKLALDEVQEYAGHLYRLGEVRTAPAASGSVRVATPAGVPFLVAYGSTDTGPAVIRVQLDGLDTRTAELSGPNGAGRSIAGQPSRDAGAVTLHVVDGKPVKGTLVVAVYTPMR